jgi:hypothetical protein
MFEHEICVLIGSIVSLLPLTTRNGWLMALKMEFSESLAAHQVISALACGSVIALPLSGSLPTVLALVRFRKARPGSLTCV